MIPVTLRPDLLGRGRTRFAMDEGMTLAEIALATPGLPAGFWEHGAITVGGAPVERRLWHVVRPKTGRGACEIVVNLYMVPGKGNGQMLRIVATIALLAAVSGISGGAAAGLLGPAFAAGGLGAALGGAAVGISGQLLINALVPPPKPKDPATARDPISAGVSGNTATPLSLMQRVAGKMHVSPPYLAWPYTYLVGQDVYVEAVVGLCENHLIENIRVNDTDIAENETVEDYETREGTGAEAAIAICAKTVVEERPGLTMSIFDLQTSGARTALENQALPVSSSPKWHSFNMRGEGDEARFRFNWPSGIVHVTRADDIGVAYRLQFRLHGAPSWSNGPEMHFKDVDRIVQEWRQEIRIRFEAGPVLSAADWSYRATELTSFAFWSAAPGQAWAYAAESYFDPGTGTLLADHVTMDDNGFTVWLDPAVFERGEYEFRLKRSLSYEVGHLRTDGAAYQYNGSPLEANLFDYYDDAGTWRVRIAQNSHSTMTVVESFATIDDAYPLPSQTEVPMTLIAVKVKNGTINSISADFTSRVKVWNGADWNTLAPSRNPAALFRHFRLDPISAKPLAPALLDSAVIEDWYDHCVLKGYECNAVVSGSIEEALNLTAAAGWAAPRHSDRVGVIVERDLSGEGIVQNFTPLNSANYRARKPFADISHAIYAEFFDQTNKYTLKTRIVYGDGYDASTATLFDTMRYESITDPAQIDARALMDWRQQRYRPVHRMLDVGAEHLVSDRGDLVGLTHDVVGERFYYGLVEEVIDNGTDVTGLVLEAVMEISGAGGAVGLAIRCEDKTSIEAAIAETADTRTVTFVTPFTIPAGGVLAPGCLVAAGLVGEEHRRCRILGIRRKGALRASLTLVDEKPEIHTLGNGRMDFSVAGNSQYSILV